MVCTLCSPKENTTSVSIRMSFPNPDPSLQLGNMDRLPHTHCTQLVGLAWKRPLRYHRYFPHSCPNLFHVDLVTLLCLKFLLALIPDRIFCNYWSAFAQLEPIIIYLLITEHPFPTPSQE